MPRQPLNCSNPQQTKISAKTTAKTTTALHSQSKYPSHNNTTSGVMTQQIERFAEDYLLDCDYRLHSPQTIATRRIFLKNLVWFLHHRNYEYCGPAEMRQFFVYLARGHEEEGGRFGNKRLTRAVRPVTHKDYWVNFKCFFNWLLEENLIDSSQWSAWPNHECLKKKSNHLRQNKSKPF